MRLPPLRMSQGLLFLFGIFLLALTIDGSVNAAVKVSEGAIYGRPVTIVDNGLLRMAVTREIGGRVLSIVDQRTNFEFLRIAAWNMHLGPTNEWGGGDYGGITDVEYEGWPGSFWGETYQLKVIENKGGEVTLQLQAEVAKTALERTITLAEGSTRLRFRTTQKNVADYAKPMMIRLHGEYRVGTRADDNDRAYWLTPKGEHQEMNYVLGAESFGWRNAWRARTIDALGWFGVVDRVDGAALVGRSVPQDKTIHVGWWNGFNEGDLKKLERDESGGLYNFDFMGEKTNVAPGGTISGEQDLLVINGIRQSLRQVKEDLVVAADMDRGNPTYGTQEPVGAIIQVGACVAQSNIGGKAEVLNGSQKVLQSFPIKFDQVGAGESATQKITIPAGALKDGAYSLACSLQVGNETLGSFRLAFSVDSQAVDAVVARENELAGQLSGWEKKISGIKKDGKENIELLVAVARSRREQADEALAAGDFTLTSKLQDALADILKNIEDNFQSVQKNKASRSTASEKLNNWVRQMRKRPTVRNEALR